MAKKPSELSSEENAVLKEIISIEGSYPFGHYLERLNQFIVDYTWELGFRDEDQKTIDAVKKAMRSLLYEIQNYDQCDAELSRLNRARSKVGHSLAELNGHLQ